MTDLSGAAFSNVDAVGNAADFIAYLDIASSSFRPVKRFALSLLQLEPSQFALDLGCGCGDDLREMASLVAPSGLAIGVDNSASLIEEARRRHSLDGLPLKFEKGHAAQLRWPDGFFHACYADRVLQHLNDPDRVLREVNRVLKPRGRIVVVERDWGMVRLDAADGTTTNTILDRARTGIVNGWIGKQLSKKLRNTGFTAIEVYPHWIDIEKFATVNALLDLQTVLDHAVAERLIQRRSAELWIADLLDRDRAGKFFASILLLAAFCRKTG
jgi:ubiquinone/menaquinone biosynthesis C-methylase UbiE